MLEAAGESAFPVPTTEVVVLLVVSALVELLMLGELSPTSDTIVSPMVLDE